ncbi:MAG: FliH/SctL family protein [Caulobacterales bacterium]
MTAAAPRKFSFDTEFASDGRVVRSDDTFRTSYSRADMEKLTAAAFEKGKNEENARANVMMADAQRRMAEAMERLVGGLSNEANALRSEAAAVAIACARKVAGCAIARFPEEEVLSAIEEAMSVLRDAPRLVVGVSPELQERVRERVAQLADQFGYGAAVVVRAEPGMRLGDAAIVWGDGAIALDREDAFARLEAAIERRLTDADQEQPDLFTGQEGH